MLQPLFRVEGFSHALVVFIDLCLEPPSVLADDAPVDIRGLHLGGRRRHGYHWPPLATTGRDWYQIRTRPKSGWRGVLLNFPLMLKSIA